MSFIDRIANICCSCHHKGTSSQTKGMVEWFINKQGGTGQGGLKQEQLKRLLYKEMVRFSLHMAQGRGHSANWLAVG